MTAAVAGHPAHGGWDGLVVICSASRYDGIPMADHHLANHLSQLAPVLFVDPPMSRLTPLRRPGAATALAGPRLRVERAGLARLTPVVQPLPSRPGTVHLTSVLARGHLRRAVAALGGSVSAVISAWPQYPVFGQCGELVRVYWAQDDYAGGAALLGLSARLIERREPRIAVAADLVVTVAPDLADTWRRRGVDPMLIPNGAETSAYRDVDAADLPADVRLPPPVAGFVGHINERTDLALLEAVAARGRSLLLIGPKKPAFEPARFAALAGLPNVRWVGPKPFADLPGYLRAIDVGLVPYGDSAFNRGSFPLKTLEYLAAGRPVVSTDLPSTRWLGTSLVAIASGPAEFADLVDRAAAQPRTEDAMERRREFAAAHSWSRRAADFHAAIAARREASALAPGIARRRG